MWVFRQSWSGSTEQQVSANLAPANLVHHLEKTDMGSGSSDRNIFGNLFTTPGSFVQFRVCLSGLLWGVTLGCPSECTPFFANLLETYAFLALHVFACFSMFFSRVFCQSYSRKRNLQAFASAVQKVSPITKISVHLAKVR